MRTVLATAAAALLFAPGVAPAPPPAQGTQRTRAIALDVAAGATGVWVLSQLVRTPSGAEVRSRLERIDPASGRVLRRVEVPISAGRLVQGRSGRLWVLGAGLAVLDPRRGGATMLPAGACGMLVADAAPGIWTATTCQHGTITRITPDGRPLGTALHLRGGRVVALALGADGLFVARAGRGPGVLERRDPGGGRLLRRVAVGPGPRTLVLGGGSLWSLGSDAVLRRIHPTTLRTTARLRLPRTGSAWGGLAVGPGGPRVVDPVFGVARIDPRTQQTRVHALRGAPRNMMPIAIAAGRRHVWMVLRSDGWDSAVCRVNPRTDSAERCVTGSAGR